MIRDWERKIDRLKERASRVVVNMNDVGNADKVIDQIRSTGSVKLSEELQAEPALVETRRRLDAAKSEHMLEVSVGGCKVTLVVMAADDRLRPYYHLAISFRNGRPPTESQGPPWTVPRKFDKIRERLGGPQDPAACGRAAMHWIWDA